MGYRLLADAVVVIHLAFILYAVLGGLLVLRLPRTAWLHLPAVIWAGAVECTGWFCPLTRIENHLRMAAGLAGYSGGFIERYLIAVIYPENLTRNFQIALGAVVIVLNTALYLWAVFHPRSSKQA